MHQAGNGVPLDMEEYLYVNGIYHMFKDSTKTTIKCLIRHMDPENATRKDFRVAQTIEYLADATMLTEYE